MLPELQDDDIDLTFHENLINRGWRVGTVGNYGSPEGSLEQHLYMRYVTNGRTYPMAWGLRADLKSTYSRSSSGPVNTAMKFSFPWSTMISMKELFIEQLSP